MKHFVPDRVPQSVLLANSRPIVGYFAFKCIPIHIFHLRSFKGQRFSKPKRGVDSSRPVSPASTKLNATSKWYPPAGKSSASEKQLEPKTFQNVFSEDVFTSLIFQRASNNFQSSHIATWYSTTWTAACYRDRVHFGKVWRSSVCWPRWPSAMLCPGLFPSHELSEPRHISRIFKQGKGLCTTLRMPGLCVSTEPLPHHWRWQFHTLSQVSHFVLQWCGMQLAPSHFQKV